MDADSIFPNRKQRAGNPRSEGFSFPVPDAPAPFGNPAEPFPQSAGSQETPAPAPDAGIVAPEPPAQDAAEGRAWKKAELEAGYRIIEPEPETREEFFVFSPPQSALPPSAERVAEKAGAENQVRRPRSGFVLAGMEMIRRFAQNPVRVYAAAGVGLGILVGVIFAAALLQREYPRGRYDLVPIH
ncbi:MAG: hypothetical protein ACP5FH_08650 [Terracidiphilus sp.]